MSSPYLSEVQDVCARKNLETLQALGNIGMFLLIFFQNEHYKILARIVRKIVDIKHAHEISSRILRYELSNV